MAKNILKELSMLDGIAGNEKEVRLYIEKSLSGFTNITYDGLGSIVTEKIGNESGPKIMIAAHMDEVGFIVTNITKDGYLKFVPSGGWYSQVLLSQQFTVTSSSGKKYYGVIGAKPPHILSIEERKIPAKIENMYLDIGVNDKEEAESLGIKLGDMISPYIEYREMANKDYLLGKAWDDRAGVACTIDVMNNLKKEVHNNILYGVGTVQEEVGLRGATTSANMIKPDIGIALDVTICDDFPGGEKLSVLGKGPCIVFYDRSMVGHKGLRDFIISICDELKIPYQLSFLNGGGTDAGKIHISNSGVPSVALCLATRYLHSHTSIIHRKDYENMVLLVTELIKRLDTDTVNRITYS